MVQLSCINCGGEYREQRGVLIVYDTLFGEFRTNNVDYFNCNRCNELLIPDKSAIIVDKFRNRRKEELLKELPIENYFTVTETAEKLKISRQALHKNKKIQSGMIYYTLLGENKVFEKRSVEKYLNEGDGRFPLVTPQFDEFTIIPEKKSKEEIKYLIAIEERLWIKQPMFNSIPFHMLKQYSNRNKYNV